jgi:hypothetical protein
MGMASWIWPSSMSVEMARIANLVSTGQPHFESPLGVAVSDCKGGEKTYSVRTLPTDFLHAISDPREFIMGRVNPLIVGTGIEAATGRNEQGQRVTGTQQVSDLAKNTTPIPLQGLARHALSNTDQVTKALGGTVTPYRTVAEKLTGQLASDRNSTGPVDQAGLAKHQARMQSEDSLRMGHCHVRYCASPLQERPAIGARRQGHRCQRKENVPTGTL